MGQNFSAPQVIDCFLMLLHGLSGCNLFCIFEIILDAFTL